jgi:hypothetical protein
MEARQGGEAKMKEMMQAAKKRLKAASKKPRLLKIANG